MQSNGVLPTGTNAINKKPHRIKKYEKAFDVYQENNSSIPESYWQNLIKGVN